jgi:hypothetical protein
VKDLMKLAPLVQNWPWPKLGYVLVLGLLLKQIVTFEQGEILILLAMVIDKFGTPGSRAHAGKATGKEKSKAS